MIKRLVVFNHKSLGLWGLPCLLLFSLSRCSAIESAVNLLDECLDYSGDETNAGLNEDCRDLADFLPDNQDNLASQTLILAVRESGESTDVSLLITDSTGGPVTGLTADSVAASGSGDGGSTFEDLPAADVATLEELGAEEEGTVHLSFSSVIDYSASILDDDLGFVTSALTFLYEELLAGYRSEVVKFSTDVQVTQAYTAVQEDLLTAVQDESYEREYTSLYDGMLQGIEDTADETSSLKLVVLFTDGIDNDSGAAYDEVKTSFQANDIPVCVVGVGFADIDELTRIAEDSGCFFVYRTVFDDLEGVFETVSDLIDNTYRVRFDSSDLEGFDTLKLNITTAAETREVTTPL